MVPGAHVRTEFGDVGIVRFRGLASFRAGEWVGIALAKPKGKNDGTVQGTRYFECLPSHGLFARPGKLILLDDTSMMSEEEVGMLKALEEQGSSSSGGGSNTTTTTSTAAAATAAPSSTSPIVQRPQLALDTAAAAEAAAAKLEPTTPTKSSGGGSGGSGGSGRERKEEVAAYTYICREEGEWLADTRATAFVKRDARWRKECWVVGICLWRQLALSGEVCAGRVEECVGGEDEGTTTCYTAAIGCRCGGKQR